MFPPWPEVLRTLAAVDPVVPFQSFPQFRDRWRFARNNCLAAVALRESLSKALLGCTEIVRADRFPHPLAIPVVLDRPSCAAGLLVDRTAFHFSLSCRSMYS